jgi:hypothetical protein
LQSNFRQTETPPNSSCGTESVITRI